VVEVVVEPKVAITNIIWSYDRQTHKINLLLIRRAEQPFQNYWALPETSLRIHESADQAALRLVHEKIGLKLSRFHTEQLETFTNPLRSPGHQREIALAYMTFLPDMPNLNAGYGAIDAQWFELGYDQLEHYTFTKGNLFFTLDQNQTESSFYQHFEQQRYLAFDHEWLINVACMRIRNKLDYQPNILLVLGQSFTLKEARKVYAAFLKISVQQIDNSNFRKTHGWLFQEAGLTAARKPGRPARLYRLKLKV
jgi:ADP-ribose pyrophosphatase YjhB (NUDIX family)